MQYPNILKPITVRPLRDDLMVQQQLPARPTSPRIRAWQHMVAVIMLNQTGRKPVKAVFPEFISRWHRPDKFFWAIESQVKDVIRPLGMVNVRYNRLWRMTKDFPDWDLVDARQLYGIGKYGSDSYEIFFKQNYTTQPTDKELRRYLDDLGIA